MRDTSQSTEQQLGERYRSIRRVLWVVLALNLAVAVAKLFYGIVSHSVAMQADGIHSFFDGTSNVVALVGLWVTQRPADESHPYGHGKFETFAAAAIGVMLVVAGYTVGRGAIDHLSGQSAPTVVGAASFVVMFGTLAVNIVVTTWENRAGRRLRSEVLVADSRHTLSDVAASIGVIVSLVAVKLGWEQADGVVALLVAVVIFRTAIGVIRGVGRTRRARWPACATATPCARAASRARSSSTCMSSSRLGPRSRRATRSPTRSRTRCAGASRRSSTSSSTSSPRRPSLSRAEAGS
jgi:Co/Zn/Cd efflux system component